ncbi:MAG TPA: glycosyltransferase [Steroidobacteraceae bacterium]|nr:glycosyltransferase [Steroidobacteraceae bacterium]
MSPTVSIVMPTFNRLEFLPPTLDSVRAQTFTDWELIIADDGSGDGPTRDYLRSLDDGERVRVLWLKHSGLQGVACNAAIRQARGTYVAFLDSDDIWLAGKLSRQIASLRLNSSRRWSCTHFAVIDSSGAIVRTGPRRAHQARSGWIREALLRSEISIALPSVVVERALLEQLGCLDEQLRMCADNELWFRLAALTEIDVVEETLTLIRRHNQHGGSDVIAWEDRLRIFERLLREESGSSSERLLRSQRAVHEAGLARSQAASGRRREALATLLASAPHSCRYAGWWPNAFRAAVRACAPRPVVSAIRRIRATG